jgi:hypothetical protein
MSFTKAVCPCALICAGMLTFPEVTLAWDGIESGVLTTIDVTDGPAYAVRAYLPQTLCGSVYNWGYLNFGDPNYSVYSAALMMAKATGATVTLYTNRDSGTGYCHIQYISIS